MTSETPVSVPQLPTGAPVPASHPLRVGRIFDLNSVETTINRTIAALPEGHTWGLIIHGEETGDGTAMAAVAFVVKKGPLQWQVQASCATDEHCKAETNLVISGK